MGFDRVDPRFGRFGFPDFLVVKDGEFRVFARVLGALRARDLQFEARVDGVFQFQRDGGLFGVGHGVSSRRDCRVSVMEGLVTKGNALKSVRAAYDFDTADFDPGIDCSGFVGEEGEWFDTPSLTRQADAEDCDINVMMAKYQATGQPPRVNPREPQWGDFSSVPQFQDALNLVHQVETDFALLDARVRDRFANSPAKLLRFLEDPANYDEAVKLGVVVPRPEPPAAGGGVGGEPPTRGSGAPAQGGSAAPPKPKDGSTAAASE